MSSFGVAFDIDGVVLRGRLPIGGSPRALRRFYSDSGDLKIPFLFLTNGGGTPESMRATELSDIFGVKILPSQVVQGHAPFKSLVSRFENELILATGKGDPALVMSNYGFKKVLSIDEYVSYFDNIDPVSQYKAWKTQKSNSFPSNFPGWRPPYNVYEDKVKAAFVISDPVDWGRDIQVLCDILRSEGLAGASDSHQIPLFFAADDLQYQAAFPAERLGMGAFRIALESVYNRIHHSSLKCTTFGKPNPCVFKNVESVLRQLKTSCNNDDYKFGLEDMSVTFKTLYMIGDNPAVDIKGAQQSGHPWFSILTRTGVFRGKGNHLEFPADLVVDSVEQAVEYIMYKERQ